LYIDCIQSEGEEYGVPEFVLEKLQALVPSEEEEMELAG